VRVRRRIAMNIPRLALAAQTSPRASPDTDVEMEEWEDEATRQSANPPTHKLATLAHTTHKRGDDTPYHLTSRIPPTRIRTQMGKKELEMQYTSADPSNFGEP
jgi:hypothetical protein